MNGFEKFENKERIAMEELGAYPLETFDEFDKVPLLRLWIQKGLLKLGKRVGPEAPQDPKKEVYEVLIAKGKKEEFEAAYKKYFPAREADLS